ncbi:cytochrome b-245 light chain-like [Oscarella lobularis]|uniref:cytochrome b-245 light chain-like n=1 Tax=Oscarella lobularis TaxID=121494 RepID=UPI0033143403
MGRIEWSIWANVQAVFSTSAILMGGIIGCFGFPNTWAAYYAIALSVVLFLLEYPRGKRRKGSTPTRIFQRYFEAVYKPLGPLYSIYFIRFVLYMGACVPLCFCLPTILGAIFLFSAGVLYLVAALNNEKWAPASAPVRSTTTAAPRGKISEPPSQPPPRAPKKEKEELE